MSATITTRAAALALHLSHRQVRTLISTGQLPARITPRGYRISPLDLHMVAAGVRRGRGRPRRPSVLPWVDCGCCGRTHQDIWGADCRSFTTCAKCGDCYHSRYLSDHVSACKGVALSEQPGAQFTDSEDE